MYCIDIQNEKEVEEKLDSYQRILVRDEDDEVWKIGIYEGCEPRDCVYAFLPDEFDKLYEFGQYVPYNEETWHLLATTENYK